jgi:hypothetical protein
MSDADKRAGDEAYAMYSTDVRSPNWRENLKPENIKKQQALRDKVERKYKIAVAQRFGVTLEANRSNR